MAGSPPETLPPIHIQPWKYFICDLVETIRTQTVNDICETMGRASNGMIKAVNEPHFLLREDVQMLYLFYPIVKIIAKGPI